MEDITIHYWFMIGITSQDDIDIEDGSVYLMGAGSELLELVISVAGVASVSVDISAASPVSIAGTGSWFVSVSATRTPLPGSVRDISLAQAQYTCAVHPVWGPHVISINWRRHKQSTNRHEDCSLIEGCLSLSGPTSDDVNTTDLAFLVWAGSQIINHPFIHRRVVVVD